jgi:signal transduction histidine kinase
VKHLLQLAERYRVWLLLLLGVDGFCAIIIWVSDIPTFRALIGFMVLASIIFFSVILYVLNRRTALRRKLFEDFLNEPTICNEERLLSAVSREEGEYVRMLASALRRCKAESTKMADDLRDYEEYAEGWAHEAKTPLSLLIMILDNRNDEMSPSLHAKLDYVRSQLQENIMQMLYYARLKSSTKDYRFENINLNDCLNEVLENYSPLLDEKQFLIINKLQTETVYTDRRGLQFMLGQIISNSIKYSGDNPTLTISMTHSDGADILSVEDNGIGVKEYDLPYIFQKGFTGDSTASRKKATGMGLYLTRKMADDLNLKLDASSAWGGGFRLSIIFPAQSS